MGRKRTRKMRKMKKIVNKNNAYVLFIHHMMCVRNTYIIITLKLDGPGNLSSDKYNNCANCDAQKTRFIYHDYNIVLPPFILIDYINMAIECDWDVEYRESCLWREGYDLLHTRTRTHKHTHARARRYSFFEIKTRYSSTF